MRSLLPQLSMECCFFHFGEDNWRKISELLNRDAHLNIWKFLEVLKYRVEEASSPPWGLFVKKSSKAVSREKRLQKIVSEFQMKTNNGHTCMDYLEGLAHNVTYWLDQILYGTVLSLIEKAVLMCVRYLKIPEISLRCRKSIVVVKWMEIKFSMFLNFFDVISIFFRCFFSMFSLSMFCLFRVFAFLCFVVLCFVIDPVQYIVKCM